MRNDEKPFENEKKYGDVDEEVMVREGAKQVREKPGGEHCYDTQIWSTSESSDTDSAAS